MEINPPSQLAGNPAADFDDPIDEAEPSSKREGLPADFRMRNAHYVDQLETPPRPVLKPLAIDTIDAGTLRDAPASLIESIRKYGVLEPLLVQQSLRGRHYRLISGRRRLVAARAAGLREVPCVVHTISDAEAAELMDATRSGGERVEAAIAPHPTAVVALYPAQRDLEAALTTIESCAPLLTQPSATARRGALQVIEVECRRAQRLLKAMRVLTDTVAIHRTLLKPADLFDRLTEVFRDEQRLLGVEPAIQVHSEPQLAFYGDDQLLLTAMAGALAALTAAAGHHRREVTFMATGSPADTVSLALSDRSVVLPDSFVRTAFTTSWPLPDGDTVLVLLQSARRIALAHNGSLTLAADGTRTTFRLELPREPVPRAPMHPSAN